MRISFGRQILLVVRFETVIDDRNGEFWHKASAHAKRYRSPNAIQVNWNFGGCAGKGCTDCCLLVTLGSYDSYRKKAYNIGEHTRFVVRLMRFAFVASSGEEHRSPMVDRLCLKLKQFIRLSASDRETLASLAETNVRVVRSRRDIIREGEQPRFVNMIVDGWAIRYKMLEDGRRQIIAFLIPGDICDLDIWLIGEMDHSIGALTEVKIAQLPPESFEQIQKAHPRIAKGLMCDMLVQAAIQREWTVNLGQRSAIERIAHLICELFTRLDMIESCVDNTCQLPITQTDLSEATGITPVHVNRTIQELRAQGLIEWKGREVHVPDMDSLKRIAMFNNNYLHLKREGALLDVNG